MIDPLRALRVHQAGVCALCERVGKRLVVDHDHVTKLVRGLLCVRCNTSEGHEDYPWVRAYRANPPAVAIGLVVRYGKHRPRAPRRNSLLPQPGWMERLMASPVGPPLAAGAYLDLCDLFGYCYRPCDVSAAQWRARLEESAEWSAKPQMYCLEPFERRLASRAAAWEQRDREDW